MPRAKESTAGASTAQAQQEAVSEGIDNFELPRSLIMKLARASQVPENTKFSKEVILAILKASTVFINYLAATAHEVATSKQHKSISATDVLKALELVELADIAKNIQGELPLYRDLQKTDKRKGGKGKAKDTSTESASAGPKGKGKGKAATGPSSDAPAQGLAPKIHIPAGRPAAAPSSEAGPSEGIDEDQEMADAEQDQGEEPGQDDAEDEEIDEDDDVEEEDEDDAEPPEDIMAVEEEELRKDAKGLEAANRDEAVDED
ncbi:histone-fold-containing protein [Lentinus tigrinus ALCF2SS1-7]|uniref:DNA polymerase epsilon subunit D n=1 Tax=Lentinus tigrinus ALCF2SS1-6 TaxID=1328759 RepID=A0A5C2S5L5_9APHY|nr:histone-fold-containing protein [Lentinus tigrinus ALCF2SS1-6]RPD72873.1 histone-fold-containing protein [Lentinus tigrinus ALCF2SS1-7]